MELAASSPPAPVLGIFHLIMRMFTFAYVAADVTLLALAAHWLLTKDGLLALWAHVAWWAAGSVAMMQLWCYSVCAVLALFPHLQAFVTFLHFVKYFACANSAGPFDDGYGGLGRRDHNRPALAGLPHARAVRLRAADGVEIGGWHVLPAGTVGLSAVAASTAADGRSVEEIYDSALARADESRACGQMDALRSGVTCCLYLHGLGETRTKWVCVEHAKLLSCHLQLHVLVIDWRGFGDSAGYPSEAGLRADAAAALAWLETRGVPASRVLVWGHSLGTGFAVWLAIEKQRRLGGTRSDGDGSLEDKGDEGKGGDVECGCSTAIATGRAATAAPITAPFTGEADDASSGKATGAGVRAVILEAPYTSLIDAAITFPTSIPFRALPFGENIMRRWFFYVADTLHALPTLEGVPVLVAHGTADPLVPFAHSVELARAVSASGGARCDVRFVPLPGCDHLHAIFRPEFLPALVGFLSGLGQEREAVVETR